MESVEQLPHAQPTGSSASDEQSTSRPRRKRRGLSREELRAKIDILERQRRAFAVTSALLGVACLGLGIGVWRTQVTMGHDQALSEERSNRLELGMRQSAEELRAATHELEQAQQQIKALVAERLPGLSAVELYHPIQVGQDFIRDITFEPIRAQDRQGLEYKVVVENASADPIQPWLAVQLFDRVGVQVAESRPIKRHGEQIETLRAGEIRSYFEVFETTDGVDPAYFRLVAEIAEE